MPKTNSTARTRRRPAPPPPYQPQWYPSPIDLPARRHGTAAIRHRRVEPGERVDVVGLRQALTRDITPAHGVVGDEGLTIHELHEFAEQPPGTRARRTGGRLWMTDSPEELNQIYEALHHHPPHGTVLVGGLGLGLLTRIILGMPGVTSVRTVERNADIITLCGRGLDCIHADIHQYLNSADIPKPDCIYLDTWGGTNEGTWWEEVVPLRRRIRARWGSHPRIHCWAEDIMLGQVQRALMSPHSPHWYYTATRNLPWSYEDAVRYTTTVGEPDWEAQYGATLDAYLAVKAQNIPALED